jgi:hypothetical protein
MTTIADFDISTDLKTEFYLAGGGTNDFIIGVSRLGGVNVLAGAGIFYIGSSLIGGSDVLGGEDTGFEWTDLNCETSLAQVTIGGQVQDQLYFQPSPGTAQLTLQSLEYDPIYSPAFRSGVQVRLRLVKDAVDQIIWSGIVDSITTGYSPDNKSVLQVTALDSFKRLMNTRLALVDTDTDFPEGFVTPYEQLEVIADQFGTAMHSSSVETAGEIPSTIVENVIPSSLVYEAIQVGLGVFWIDPATQEFVFIPRPVPGDDVPEGTIVFSNDHSLEGHLCMTNIKASSTEDTVYNSLLVELKSDDTINTLRTNQDSIDLYGTYAQDVTLNTTDLDELNRWADSVFVQSPTSLVDSVETLTKDRLGNLTEAAFILPGEKVGVKYNEGILEIDGYFTTTRVSHYIDPDNWLTTLDLWKEA